MLLKYEYYILIVPGKYVTETSGPLLASTLSFVYKPLANMHKM